MTRIIAGRVGGRRLKVPPAGTRPTSDRVREALFSGLAARLDFAGLRVLDLYAGSGALGLEALSRGATHALLVEQDARAAAVIKANVTELGLRGAQVRVGSVAATLAAPPDEPYDLVFADPPYAFDEVRKDLEALTKGWLAADAVVVYERSARAADTVWPAGYDPDKPRRYGETRIELAHYNPE